MWQDKVPAMCISWIYSAPDVLSLQRGAIFVIADVLCQYGRCLSKDLSSFFALRVHACAKWSQCYASKKHTCYLHTCSAGSSYCQCGNDSAHTRISLATVNPGWNCSAIHPFLSLQSVSWHVKRQSLPVSISVSVTILAFCPNRKLFLMSGDRWHGYMCEWTRL